MEELERNAASDKNAEMKTIDKSLDSATHNGADAYDELTAAGDKRYYDTIDRIQNHSGQHDKKGVSYWIKELYISVYKIFSAIRIMAVPIIIISESIGIVGIWMSQKNKRSRRFFLYILCIGIPALVLFSIFGFGSLSEIFY